MHQEEHEEIVRRRENPDSGLTWNEYKSMKFTFQVSPSASNSPLGLWPYLQYLIHWHDRTAVYQRNSKTGKYSTRNFQKITGRNQIQRCGFKHESRDWWTYFSQLFHRAYCDIISFGAGYTIPAGWALMVSPPSVHLNPNKYRDPLDFNPWRWEVSISTLSLLMCNLFDAGSYWKLMIPTGNRHKWCIKKLHGLWRWHEILCRNRFH